MKDKEGMPMHTKNITSLTLGGLAAISLAFALGACSTAPENAPTTEAAPAPAPTTTAQPAGRKPVPGVDLTARTNTSSALKDPNNILSKRSVYFDYDMYTIKDEYKAVVEAHARYLRDNPGAKMMIQGNADERGSREYNVGLGQRRSDTVKRALILLGAREGQIESVSLGEEKPQADGHDESAWSKNRRSDILYGGEY
jgi:peptidoglycan-associated lipoprotein